MIFLTTLDEQLFCFFSEHDVRNMRDGLTMFVNAEQLHHTRLTGAVFALAPSDQLAIQTIKDAGHDVNNLPSPKATPDDDVCGDCKGIMKKPMLLDGKCIVCWRRRATKGVN